MTSRRTVLLRVCLGAATLMVGLSITALSGIVLLERPHGPVDWALEILFVIVMSWEAMIVVQVIYGFVSWLSGSTNHSDLERLAATIDLSKRVGSSTAIIVPIFDEDVEMVVRNVEAIRRSLGRLGPSDDVEIHVLSDSRELRTINAEIEAFAGRERRASPRVHYRHRAINTGRKAGNIAEFLERTRGRYDFMVVLDADSLMSGRAIRTLIRLMEESPRVGTIQTISYAAGRTTIFARIQQFAVRLHAPLSLKGMSAWQDADGLYYGHNAIIRCEPFLLHAQLPVLSGRPPLGGEILCHDVVEAALMRRAGWEVRSLPDLDETWEEMPTNVVDLLGRERRWCQGNLQHIRVAALPGLTFGSRFHIFMGIGGYLVGPLWWAFLIGGAVRVLASLENDGFGVLAYGATEPGAPAAALFWLSVTMLLVVRILNILRAILDSRHRREFGGGWRLLASAGLEQVFSILLAPTLSLFTIRFVAATFAGKVVQWNAQSRADRLVAWEEALRLLWPHLIVGALLFAAACSAGGWYALWVLPTAIGLLCGPALAVWSSRPWRGGSGFRAFSTIDEIAPADELRWATQGWSAFAKPRPVL